MTVHAEGVRLAQDAILDGSPLCVRRIEVGGREVQLTEFGQGPPALVVHGTGPGALFLAPLLERLGSLGVVAPDRPGRGLSDPSEVPPDRHREFAVAWIDGLLDRLGWESTALVGHSMGGTWALWYALARPARITRLALMAPPLLPGTRCPFPYRVMGTPGAPALMGLLSPPSPEAALRFAEMMGEGQALRRHPRLVDLIVAAEQDPVARAANLAEVRSIVSPFGLLTPTGFRPVGVTRAELRGLGVPTLLVWGDREPLGGVSVAEAVVDDLPDGRLEVVAAGHAPWLGHPDRVAAALGQFLAGSPSRR